MDDGHPQVGENLGLEPAAVLLGGLHPLRVLLVHRRADHIHLPPLGHLFPGKGEEPLPLVPVDQVGGHRGAPRWQLVQHRQVQVPVDHQRQGPGDGGGGHHQHVGVEALPPLGRQGGPLAHPEAVLLVGDHQAQAGEVHPLAEQGVGAHQQVGLPRRQAFPAGPLLGGGHGPGEQVHH